MNKIILAALIAFSSSAQAVVVLGYHGISDKKSSMNTSLDLFKQHMKYLHDEGYYVASSEELLAAINMQLVLPEKTVVLTFDDGWKNQNQAMQVMTEYKMPATFALVTSFQAINSPTDLQKEDFEMYPQFTYISHTYTHNVRDFLVHPDADIAKSEQVLFKLFGKFTPYYIHPYGIISKRVIASLIAHNYEMAYGVEGRHVNFNKIDRYNVPRYIINQSTSLDKFKKIVAP